MKKSRKIALTPVEESKKQSLTGKSGSSRRGSITQDFKKKISKKALSTFHPGSEKGIFKIFLETYTLDPTLPDYIYNYEEIQREIARGHKDIQHMHLKIKIFYVTQQLRLAGWADYKQLMPAIEDKVLNRILKEMVGIGILKKLDSLEPSVSKLQAILKAAGGSLGKRRQFYSLEYENQQTDTFANSSDLQAIMKDNFSSVVNEVNRLIQLRVWAQEKHALQVAENERKVAIKTRPIDRVRSVLWEYHSSKQQDHYSDKDVFNYLHHFYHLVSKSGWFGKPSDQGGLYADGLKAVMIKEGYLKTIVEEGNLYLRILPAMKPPHYD